MWRFQIHITSSTARALTSRSRSYCVMSQSRARFCGVGVRRRTGVVLAPGSRAAPFVGDAKSAGTGVVPVFVPVFGVVDADTITVPISPLTSRSTHLEGDMNDGIDAASYVVDIGDADIEAWSRAVRRERACSCYNNFLYVLGDM